MCFSVLLVMFLFHIFFLLQKVKNGLYAPFFATIKKKQKVNTKFKMIWGLCFCSPFLPFFNRISVPKQSFFCARAKMMAKDLVLECFSYNWSILQLFSTCFTHKSNNTFFFISLVLPFFFLLHLCPPFA